MELSLKKLQGIVKDRDDWCAAVHGVHLGLIPGLGRPPGEGHGNPFQYSCLENYMDRGAWRAAVHGAAELNTTGQLNKNNTNIKRESLLHDCLSYFKYTVLFILRALQVFHSKPHTYYWMWCLPLITRGFLKWLNVVTGPNSEDHSVLPRRWGHRIRLWSQTVFGLHLDAATWILCCVTLSYLLNLSERVSPVSTLPVQFSVP